MFNRFYHQKQPEASYLSSLGMSLLNLYDYHQDQMIELQSVFVELQKTAWSKAALCSLANEVGADSIDSTDWQASLENAISKQRLLVSNMQLYLPVPNGMDMDEPVYALQTRAIYLWEMLVLVWYGINDTVTSPHRKQLIHSFFKALNKFNSFQDVCLLRDDLLTCLNELHPAVRLISDIDVFLNQLTREMLARKLIAAYDHDETEIQKALVTWAENSNARQLLALIDPRKEIIAALKEIVRKHGMDPSTINLNGGTIDEGFYKLTYKHSREYFPQLTAIELEALANILGDTIRWHERNMDNDQYVYDAIALLPAHKRKEFALSLMVSKSASFHSTKRGFYYRKILDLLSHCEIPHCEIRAFAKEFRDVVENDEPYNLCNLLKCFPAEERAAIAVEDYLGFIQRGAFSDGRRSGVFQHVLALLPLSHRMPFLRTVLDAPAKEKAALEFNTRFLIQGLTPAEALLMIREFQQEIAEPDVHNTFVIRTVRMLSEKEDFSSKVCLTLKEALIFAGENEEVMRSNLWGVVELLRSFEIRRSEDPLARLLSQETPEQAQLRAEAVNFIKKFINDLAKKPELLAIVLGNLPLKEAAVIAMKSNSLYKDDIDLLFAFAYAIRPINDLSFFDNCESLIRVNLNGLSNIVRAIDKGNRLSFIMQYVNDLKAYPEKQTFLNEVREFLLPEERDKLVSVLEDAAPSLFARRR